MPLGLAPVFQPTQPLATGVPVEQHGIGDLLFRARAIGQQGFHFAGVVVEARQSVQFRRSEFETCLASRSFHPRPMADEFAGQSSVGFRLVNRLTFLGAGAVANAPLPVVPICLRMKSA